MDAKRNLNNFNKKAMSASHYINNAIKMQLLSKVIFQNTSLYRVKQDFNICISDKRQFSVRIRRNLPCIWIQSAQPLYHATVIKLMYIN